jgi:hypothetical protein
MIGTLEESEEENISEPERVMLLVLRSKRSRAQVPLLAPWVLLAALLSYRTVGLINVEDLRLVN